MIAGLALLELILVAQVDLEVYKMSQLPKSFVGIGILYIQEACFKLQNQSWSG